MDLILKNVCASSKYERIHASDYILTHVKGNCRRNGACEKKHWTPKDPRIETYFFCWWSDETSGGPTDFWLALLRLLYIFLWIASQEL